MTGDFMQNWTKAPEIIRDHGLEERNDRGENSVNNATWL